MPPTPVVLGPRAEFIEKNLGLVHSCAGRFKGRGIEYDDLFSAGCMGLVKAYDGFDGSRGLCFSTYAVPVILGEIKKLFRDGGTVKVSRSLKELSLKISAVRERCVKETGQEPTVSQLAERLDVTPEQVADAMSAAMPALSLTPVSDEDGSREFDRFYEELMSEMIRSLREVERTENVCEDMLSVDEFLESIHKELFTEWADNIPVSDAKYKVQLLYVSKLVKLLDRSEKITSSRLLVSIMQALNRIKEESLDYSHKITDPVAKKRAMFLVDSILF